MPSNADYRAAYRQENITPSYSGRAHFAFVLVFVLGGIALCIW